MTTMLVQPSAAIEMNGSFLDEYGVINFEFKYLTPFWSRVEISFSRRTEKAEDPMAKHPRGLPQGVSSTLMQVIVMGFEIGQKVTLVPTQGALQKNRRGTVTSLTKTQVGVITEGQIGEIRYHIKDGLPVRKIDQQFPCYKVTA